MLLPPGTQIGRYEVQRKLGRGGMGTVYVAHDPVLGRMVAIKLFSSDVDLPDAGQRFAREARSAAALSHPNIVTVFDFGEIESQPYIVMEYVQGESIAEVIRSKAEVPIADKLRWLEGLAAGAAYAHRMSVVHRDIKPANLMIDRSGLLKILDFGIARMVGTASTTAMLLGTPGYMAPEQIRGEPVDHRADIFAMGVVFYELLALREAFPGEMAPTIMHRVMNEEPAPLTDFVPDCRADVAAIVERALKKRPEQRFESAEKMRDAINRVRTEIEAEAGLTIVPTSLPAESLKRPPATAAPATRDETDAGRRTPAGPRRTDRELLARRRAELLAVEVQNGRARLAEGNLEAAQESCLRALAVDDESPEALSLERDIEWARGAIEAAKPATVPLAGASAASLTGKTATSGAGLDDETAPRPADDGERTVYIRNTPLPMAPAQAAPPAPMPRAVAGPASSEAVVVSPAPKSEPRPARQPARPSNARLWSGKRMAVAAGAVVALLAVAAWAIWRPATVVPAGVLVIDAVPWAAVASIQNERAQPVPLPPIASTPLSLSLPAGLYTIVLTGPPPESKRTELRATVTAAVTTVATVPQFQLLTPDSYFEQYLSPATPIATVAADQTRADQP